MTKSKSQSRIVVRSLVVWFVLIFSEILHGILREIFFVRLVGQFRSNQIGVFSGSLIIIVIAYLTIRWISAKRWCELLEIGSIWLSLTVTFEFLFGRFVIQLPWQEILAGYNIAQGGLMPFGLLALLLSPMIAKMLQAKRS